MDWVMILQLVMAVITLIMEYLGGGTFTKVMVANQAPVYRLAEGQFACGKVYWTELPRMENGEFQGTVGLDCDIAGLSGGGIAQLKNHMVEQLPASASQIHQGPVTTSFDGLPSELYDTSLTLSNEAETADVRGQTTIATDGLSRLKNVFNSTEISQTGSSRYITSVNDAVEVSTADKSGWYRVQLRYRGQVKRPWFVSEKTFRDSLIQKFEEQMANRKDRVINDIAPNL